MPVLPLIDLLILIAWTILMWSVVHKALWLALATRFTVLGLTPYDFLLGAGVLLLFALALAARVWVKTNEGLRMRARAERARTHPEVLPDHPHPMERRAPDGSPGAARPAPSSGTERAATG